jgi:uncharacterized membrane protein
MWKSGRQEIDPNLVLDPAFLLSTFVISAFGRFSVPTGVKAVNTIP